MQEQEVDIQEAKEPDLSGFLPTWGSMALRVVSALFAISWLATLFFTPNHLLLATASLCVNFYFFDLSIRLIKAVNYADDSLSKITLQVHIQGLLNQQRNQTMLVPMSGGFLDQLIQGEEEEEEEEEEGEGPPQEDEPQLN